MYCPRCSQEQVSEETKFCSRCGFPLGLVSEILAHGGFLPQLADLHKSRKWLTKKNGVFFSVMWMIFFLFILTSLWAIMDVDSLAAASAVIGIFGGLMWLIAALVFLKSPESEFFPVRELPNANINTLHSANQRNLPPLQTQPAQSYVPPVNSWKAPDTGEFVRPGSVTEGTTKLLQKEDYADEK